MSLEDCFSGPQKASSTYEFEPARIGKDAIKPEYQGEEYLMVWYIADSAQVHHGPPKDALNWVNAAKGQMLRIYDGISLAATNVITSKLGIISKNPRVLLKVDKELSA